MASQPINPKTNNPYRPEHLPPPTTVPLRHCSHNEASEPIDEVECLLSLLSPSADAKKNKEHYILATADPPAASKPSAASGDLSKKRKRGTGGGDESERALRRAQALRRGARSIPGVPIVYVKRSVMILEPMSSQSETVRDSFEKGKFRAGLTDESTLGKRKRDATGDKDDATAKKAKSSGLKKIKGPNPLSVKKPKKRVQDQGQGPTSTVARPARDNPEGAVDGGTQDGDAVGDSARAEHEDPSAPKAKRKRRHHNAGKKNGDDGIDAGISRDADLPVGAE